MAKQCFLTLVFGKVAALSISDASLLGDDVASSATFVSFRSLFELRFTLCTSARAVFSVVTSISSSELNSSSSLIAPLIGEDGVSIFEALEISESGAYISSSELSFTLFAGTSSSNMSFLTSSGFTGLTLSDLSEENTSVRFFTPNIGVLLALLLACAVKSLKMSSRLSTLRFGLFSVSAPLKKEDIWGVSRLILAIFLRCRISGSSSSSLGYSFAPSQSSAPVSAYPLPESSTMKSSFRS
ncbi:hypothetical protein OGATHE_005063 [Ogataea polymorpha]|uniref:Uncharacterized protein n=1 Tax=Ogataea polymorpha TaxID=460523 RepID=A0A9P8NWX8_9ASCO|nr:hypothetical protein OGATHE_005063 [Ogataea polymorpha]